MKITKSRIEWFAEIHEDMMRHIGEVAELVYKARNPNARYAPFDIEDCSIQIGCCGIDIGWTEYSYCGDHERDSMYLPIEYLWNDDWVEKEKVKQEEEARKRKENEERQKKLQEAAAQKRKYDQYLELKKQFGE